MLSFTFLLTSLVEIDIGVLDIFVSIFFILPLLIINRGSIFCAESILEYGLVDAISGMSTGIFMS